MRYMAQKATVPQVRERGGKKLANQGGVPILGAFRIAQRAL